MALPAEQLPQIAKYDLLEELGHGGMATVYRAVDRRLQRDVAIKVIHRHLRDNGEVARRFTAEARAVAKLKHPNIVEIYDVSEEDVPERYLVAELVRGKSLRQLLTERPALPPEIVACLGVELAAALAHAHERGVVHRDVKPENVLFSLPWSDDACHEASEPSLACVKLTDFGIAKLLDQQGVTSTGQVLGSPAYMAPEQIDGDEVDARADVFSLGVLLYESMVGHLPFDGRTPGQVLKAILQGQYAPADRERPEIGERWARIVHEALAPEASQRFATMSDLRAALEAELRSLQIDRPRVELTAFLRDPAAYEEALRLRVLGLLREQGRRALREGDALRAGAAINRASVLAPGDPEVAALVTALMRAGSVVLWRRRAVAALGATVALALVGVAGWYALRPPPSVRAKALPVGSWVLPFPPAPPVASQSGAPTPAPPASSSLTGHRLATPGVGPRASADPVGEARTVILMRWPPGSTWSLDGTPLDEYQTEIKTELRVGSQHTLRVDALPSNTCCEEEKIVSFTVKPSSPDGAQQRESAVLKSRPVQFETQGPPGYFIQCARLFAGLRPATTSISFSIGTELKRTATCNLLDGSELRKSQEVTVNPGQTTRIRW